MRQLKFFLPRIVGVEIKKGTEIRSSLYDLIHSVKVDHHPMSIADKRTKGFLAYELDEWN